MVEQIQLNIQVIYKYYSFSYELSEKNGFTKQLFMVLRQGQEVINYTF